MKKMLVYLGAAAAMAFGFEAGSGLGKLANKGIDALVDKRAKKKENE